MKKLKSIDLTDFIEYMYYRINKFYYKRDGRNGAASMYALAIFFSCLIYDLFFLTLRLAGKKQQFVSTVGAKNVGTAAGALIVIFSVCIYFYFRDRYPKLRVRWRNEPRTAYVIRGWLVVIICSLPLVCAFLV